jgi:predicted nucleotide-binding protein
MDIKDKIIQLIERGEAIDKQASASRSNLSRRGIIYATGEINAADFEPWLGSIELFNDKYLRNHTFHSSIHSTYYHRATVRNSQTHSEMMGYLKALFSDEDLIKQVDEKKQTANRNVDSIVDMFTQDIDDIIHYLEIKESENEGRKLYKRIVARYDRIITGFGDGLYAYNPEQHFYDQEVDIETINDNLEYLLEKMKVHFSMNYSKGEGKNMRNDSVFIVHGHDDAAKEQVARFVEKLGLEAIILHERANIGKTIIEKIERYSDVGYAIILYTPCDEGKAKYEKDYKDRARQNVIFEHGLLIGKLGRSRVCALVKGIIETPGDISGVVYISFDENGGWKSKVIDEMNEIGFSLDKNKI